MKITQANLEEFRACLESTRDSDGVEHMDQAMAIFAARKAQVLSEETASAFARRVAHAFDQRYSI